MRIGILVPGLPPEVLAGAELQAQQAAEQLAKRGHQVTIFTRSRGFYQSPVQQNGYTVTPRRILPVRGARMLWDIAAALWDIARCNSRPQVLLCYQAIVDGLIGVVAQDLLGIPAVVSIRGNREYRDCRSVPSQFPVPLVYRKARSIILQTPRMLEDLCEVLRKMGQLELSEIVRAKARIIPNGIYLPRLPSEKQAKGSKVVYIGRLIPEKGVDDLITSMRQLPHAELLVVGDGPDRARLEALANGTTTTFVGRVSHEAVAGLLQQARVLVLPSHLGDGLPNVILEAMSWAVPVVATNTAGIPNVVSHGKTGYLCEPGDISKMVAYIGCLLADDELHRKLSEQSLRTVQPYSWSSVAPQIEQVLQECLDVRPV